LRIAGRAPVDPGVALLPTVDDAEEEKISARKHHSMTISSSADLGAADNELSISKPLDDRRRIAIHGALKGNRIVASHRHICRMFRDARYLLNTCGLTTTSIYE